MELLRVLFARFSGSARFCHFLFFFLPTSPSPLGGGARRRRERIARFFCAGREFLPELARRWKKIGSKVRGKEADYKTGERDDVEGRNDVARNGGGGGGRRVRGLKRRGGEGKRLLETLESGSPASCAPARLEINTAARPPRVILKRCIILGSEMERLGQRP